MDQRSNKLIGAIFLLRQRIHSSRSSSSACGFSPFVRRFAGFSEQEARGIGNFPSIAPVCAHVALTHTREQAPWKEFVDMSGKEELPQQQQPLYRRRRRRVVGSAPTTKATVSNNAGEAVYTQIYTERSVRTHGSLEPKG